MKIHCEVIRDLLPLYVEDVCSEATKELVENHLSKCQECRLELELMQKQLPGFSQEEYVKEAQEFTKLSKRWKRTMMKSVLTGILMMAGVILLMLVVLVFAGVRVTVVGK